MGGVGRRLGGGSGEGSVALWELITEHTDTHKVEVLVGDGGRFICL